MIDPLVCRCGHAIGDHGDRALVPACEGAGEFHPVYSPSLGYAEFFRQRVPACRCPGFTPGLLADDLFAGAGGWDVGANRLSIHARGVELMEEAVATRDAAGLETIHDDVWTYEPDGLARGLIASPPCQTFSKAGSGSGRKSLDKVLAAISSADYATLTQLRSLEGDERTALVLTPLHFATAYEYEWLAWEQVPSVLPVWEACAEVLERYGYYVWTGKLNAEQYGVPQTRTRAFLLARRDHAIKPPEPTHSRFHSRSPERLDENVLPWVSMATALGWDGTRDLKFCPTNVRPRSTVRHDTEPAPTLAFGHEHPRWVPSDVVGFPRKYDGRGEVFELDGEQYRGRDLRSGDQPALTVTEKARSWVRYQVEERINNQSGTKFDMEWPLKRPAPTIAGREIVTMPGANANRFNGATKSRNDGIRVAVWEAGVLQSFPADHPWQGTKTNQFLQVGNAVPPLLAEAALRAVTGE